MSTCHVDAGRPWDARSVANLVLDEADRLELPITNLALQKLLYFAHGMTLVEDGEPLVSGVFEAWDYGPVHPAVYEAFKQAGKKPIEFRASAEDPLTGEMLPLSKIDDVHVLDLIWRVLAGYRRSSLSVLLNVSHARGGPWDFIMKKSEHSPVLGMRITDDIILERFRNHVVGIEDHPRNKSGK